MNIPLSLFAPEKLVSRDGFVSPVLHHPAHFHTQAEIWCLLARFCRVPWRRPCIYLFKPPYAIESVPSLSGHVIEYRWGTTLPRDRRHRASKPQNSSKRVLPWQVTLGQPLIYAWCPQGMNLHDFPMSILPIYYGDRLLHTLVLLAE